MLTKIIYSVQYRASLGFGSIIVDLNGDKSEEELKAILREAKPSLPADDCIAIISTEPVPDSPAEL